MLTLQEALIKGQKRSDAVVLLFLVICLLILAFLFQGSRGIWQPDEGYYVGAAVTMLDRGDLLIPYLSERIFLEKPPITYWGIITGLKLFGHIRSIFYLDQPVFVVVGIVVIVVICGHIAGIIVGDVST